MYTANLHHHFNGYFLFHVYIYLTVLTALFPLHAPMVLAGSAPGPTAAATCASASANLNGIGSTPFQRHSITASLATQVITFAADMAGRLGTAENVAVVDPAGFLVGFLRMDNAFPGGELRFFMLPWTWRCE